MNDQDLIRACRPAIVAVGLFSLFINATLLTVPVYSLQVYDRVLTSGSRETLLMLTVLAGGALLMAAVLEAVRARVLARVSVWLERSLAPVLLARAIDRAVRHGREAHAQDLRDLAQVRAFLSGSGVFHFFDAPWVPVYVAVLWLLHPLLGGLAAGAAVVMFLIALLNDFATRRVVARANGLAARQFQRADAAARHAEVIEAMGMLGPIVARWQRDNEPVLAAGLSAADRAATIGALTRFLRLGVQVGIMAAGVHLAILQEITAGAVIAASILLARALAPVEQLIATWRGYVGARTAWRRVAASIAVPPAPRDTTRLPEPAGMVELERVSLSLPGRDEPVLQDLQFRLAPGEQLGIVGPSAAGKSCLARLLVGSCVPSGGRVRLDGMDVAVWDRADLGRWIGYVPQEASLFAGTIRQNIARMGEADDAAVIAAAALAGVHDMIVRLPLGYDTVLGDGGQGLSGGQRQRIGLARALFGSPRLLVLDEPNANLDSAGERALLDALSYARERGVTVVVIAHRPTVLSGVDKVLMLLNGRQELLGPRESVMRRLLQPAPRAAMAGAAQGG